MTLYLKEIHRGYMMNEKMSIMFVEKRSLRGFLIPAYFYGKVFLSYTTHDKLNSLKIDAGFLNVKYLIFKHKITRSSTCVVIHRIRLVLL